MASSCTAGSKIIRALEIIRVKILIPNAVVRNKYLLFVIFKLHNVYNKHGMMETVNQTREKTQVLSQVLE